MLVLQTVDIKKRVYAGYAGYCGKRTGDGSCVVRDERLDSPADSRSPSAGQQDGPRSYGSATRHAGCRPWSSQPLAQFILVTISALLTSLALHHVIQKWARLIIRRSMWKGRTSENLDLRKPHYNTWTIHLSVNTTLIEFFFVTKHIKYSSI